MYREEMVAKKLTIGITAPKGFKAVGIHCGIKKAKNDLALIYSERPATAAGVFTKNKVVAAPVIQCKKSLNTSNTFHAILINSGNANACTGQPGLDNAFIMAQETAQRLNIEPNQVFVSSTGVIGEQLPMDKVVNGIKNITTLIEASDDLSAAQAIMTTDTFPKLFHKTFLINGVEVSIGGIAKGSGMIHPNMATMLAFITTDALIEKSLLQKTLKKVTDLTFNKIVVDGDTSTNDMVLILANGASEIEIFENTNEYKIFEKNLYDVLRKLSIDIVKDGEGATKLVEINVEGALTDEDAEKAARQVALSPLVKTAIHGEDANWGRIIAAVGYSGIDFAPELFEIEINDVPILKKNYEVTLPNQLANQTLKSSEIKINLYLNIGKGKATVWTCDFSEEYVKINGSYRS
ncbi:MAG: bifunctional glutamate N-acetyltransferase/amino-acid acetyltransferase ArgJ [Melioribacteraceae bacterium]|nr:bifunctional glutamate N-acetyltransferase/amino-acid acetyltransferase ArgJ [Melioribacteraceae bacterium]